MRLRRPQFSIRRLLLATALFAIALASYVPTNAANRLWREFQHQPDNRKLAWLNADLREEIHGRSNLLQLEHVDCCYYRATVALITFGDLVTFRRRLQIRHGGGWVIREPLAARASDRPEIEVMLDLFDNKLNMTLAVGFSRASLESPSS